MRDGGDLIMTSLTEGHERAQADVRQDHHVVIGNYHHVLNP
jgi:hypothetical protein